MSSSLCLVWRAARQILKDHRNPQSVKGSGTDVTFGMDRVAPLRTEWKYC